LFPSRYRVQNGDKWKDRRIFHYEEPTCVLNFSKRRFSQPQVVIIWSCLGRRGPDLWPGCSVLHNSTRACIQSCSVCWRCYGPSVKITICHMPYKHANKWNQFNGWCYFHVTSLLGHTCIVFYWNELENLFFTLQ